MIIDCWLMTNDEWRMTNNSWLLSIEPKDYWAEGLLTIDNIDCWLMTNDSWLLTID